MLYLSDLVKVMKDGTYEVACEWANTIYQMIVAKGEVEHFKINDKILTDQLIHTCLLDCDVETIINGRIYITK